MKVVSLELTVQLGGRLTVAALLNGHVVNFSSENLFLRTDYSFSQPWAENPLRKQETIPRDTGNGAQSIPTLYFIILKQNRVQWSN